MTRSQLVEQPLLVVSVWSSPIPVSRVFIPKHFCKIHKEIGRLAYHRNFNYKKKRRKLTDSKIIFAKSSFPTSSYHLFIFSNYCCLLQLNAKFNSFPVSACLHFRRITTIYKSIPNEIRTVDGW